MGGTVPVTASNGITLKSVDKYGNDGGTRGTVNPIALVTYAGRPDLTADDLIGVYRLTRTSDQYRNGLSSIEGYLFGLALITEEDGRHDNPWHVK
jgi:hypothetical protein